MKISFLKKNLFILFICFTGLVSAQDLGSETVVVVKPFTPSVNDAFKIKETPTITDSITLEKQPVGYSLISVPVASTFVPAKGRAATVERERPPKLYDNYATLGFGNYTSVLAEFYSNIEVNRSDNFGIFFNHNSAQGGIEDVPLDHHYYDSELNLNYSSRNRNMTWNTDFGVEHQQFSWYGLPEDHNLNVEVFNPEHAFYSVYAGGEMNFEESFFDGARGRYRFFGDDYGSVEHHLNIQPKLEIPIGGEIFNTRLVVDYLRGAFDQGLNNSPGSEYNLLNLGIQSGLLILREDLTLELGAALYYHMDAEESDDGGIYVYPQVKASYKMAGEYFIAYAGLEGELRQNSYYNYVQQNPFVSPTLEMEPTDRQYNFYVGAKGKLSDRLGYNLRAGYISENFRPLFRKNPRLTFGNGQDYSYGNSFGVVYDQVNTLSGFGELSLEVNRKFDMRINGEFFSYDTEEQSQAWNLPNFRANLLADYQITDNWFAGANAFIVGQRKDIESPSITNPTEISEITLDSYFDLNANLGYRFNDRLSIFAKGYNLLGENYQKWHQYPVLGLQVMAGATYKFNWAN